MRGRAALVTGVVLLAGAFSSSPAARGQAEGSGPAVVAVLRRDGLVLPFASVTDGEWKAPWPVSARNHEIPIALGDIPDAWWGGRAPDRWHAVVGDDVRDLTVTAPVLYPGGCDRRIALRTDYTAAEPIPFPPVDPFPKDGLAIGGDLRVDPIVRISASAPQAPALAALLTQELDAVEDREITQAERHSAWRHPVKASVRHGVPVRMDAWYRAPLDDSDPDLSISYVELVRSYAPGPKDEGCGLETFFYGWVIQRQSEPGKARVDLHARVTYCDRKDVLYMLPFGRVRSGGSLFWIYQLSGWDAEWYVVTRVDDVRPKVMVEHYGGGSMNCRRPGIIE